MTYLYCSIVAIDVLGTDIVVLVEHSEHVCKDVLSELETCYRREVLVKVR